MKLISATYSFVRLSLFLLYFVLSSKIVFSVENLAIYLPTEKSNKEIKRLFKQDEKYSKFRTLVYSKIKELLKVNKSKNYDYVIAPDSFFHFNKSYKKKFTFQRNGKSKFQFQVVTISSELSESGYKDGIIAILDSTRRKNAKSYVSHLLQGRTFRKIKRVSKLEDLFPILVFRNAQYLLIRPQNLYQIRSEYTSPIYVVGESIPENYPSIGIHINKSFQSLERPSLSIIKQLGFSSVREITKEQK
jgi:hypothetical protein